MNLLLVCRGVLLWLFLFCHGACGSIQEVSAIIIIRVQLICVMPRALVRPEFFTHTIEWGGHWLRADDTIEHL